ncbi:FtsK/SpoIIIE family DNA translocase [Pseudoflavonifractor phocaeensis]|uniref:FtsK/SpoIIIE family DNA translocase n=1 Tax=Pseudoflavonifractor phocaeensis TaxID=1870988 RepID=UPI00210D0480|nr:DNA translocase FtsK [Pseudoflavonifractor phocaeensis]MCQ4864243.1 DNA translocase FtsK [Pseudoflavonifractor phocaeensis]
MATAQKKSTGGKRTASSSGARRSSSSAKSTGSRKKAAPQPKPIRREVGAVVCLLLAIFSAFGYFNIHALFIDFFVNIVKGLIGYGFWLLPPMLLATSVILALHRGRPVRARVWCAMLMPVIFGCILHLFMAKGEYTWGWELFKTLWAEGQALQSGGAVSGLMSVAFIAVFSKIGAGIVFILGAGVMLMAAANVTVVDIVDYIRDRPRPEYEEQEIPEPRPRERKAPAEPAVQKAAPSGRRKPNIDIPVDDGPMPGRAEPEPQIAEKKEKLFNRKPSVPTPDQILAGAAQERPAPVAESIPTPESVITPPPAVPTPVPEPVVVTRPAPEPAAHVPVPPMPEIEREPAVPKVKASEAARAAAEVAQEVEKNLEQGAPAYQYPPVSLLKEGDGVVGGDALAELRANQNRLSDTIRSFGIDANIVNVTRGPSVTRYELELDQGVRLNKLTNLADDIALALGATGVRIAPIPDKISMVGIEVPNKLVSPVYIHEVIDSKEFRDNPSKVSFAVGKDIGGNCIVGNIAKLPHMLIAGTTGSGKSVCTNSLIISLLYKATPEEVRLIMVDPKMVELGIYNGIPHLLIPVVTDPKKAAGALQWAVTEMMKRYRAFSEVGVRDLSSYNAHAARTEGMSKMPQIVVVIDELADLMLVAAKEVEESICRVAQMGRASGMHLVIATQRPSADVITGLMKANIPSRIAFAVASSLESRIILDTTGAEKLVGRGDMLYFPLGTGKPQRVQGCLISDGEVAAVVDFIKQSGTAEYDEEIISEIEQHAAEKEKGGKGVGGSAPDAVDDAFDELLPAAIEVVVETGQASVSMLQRRLKLGYSRAARLVDQMEEKGVVGPFEGSKPRQLLITKEQWQEMQFRQGMVDSAPDAGPVPEELDYEGDAVPQSREMPPFDMGDD